MRVLVTGSRDWPDPDTVAAALDQALADNPPGQQFTLVHGMCPTGADRHAEQWAAGQGDRVWVERHPAAWDHCAPNCQPGHRRRDHEGRQYCPSAGPRRNLRMVRAGADLCLAFLHGDSRGAAKTAQLAKKHGIPTTIHRGST